MFKSIGVATAIISLPLCFAPTARADDIPKMLTTYADQAVSFWKNQGLPIFSVTVDSSSTAWCDENGTKVKDPFAITCSNTLIRFDIQAAKDKGMDERGALTLIDHEVGHAVINQIGLQPLLLKAGEHNGTQVIELTSDCMAGIVGASYHKDGLNDYLKAARQWMPKDTAYVRGLAYADGFTGRATGISDCVDMYVQKPNSSGDPDAPLPAEEGYLPPS